MLRGVEPYSYTSIAHIKLHIRRKNVHFCYSLPIQKNTKCGYMQVYLCFTSVYMNPRNNL